MKCNMCNKDKVWAEVRYIGMQEMEGTYFALYNCKECNSTLAQDPNEETKVIKTEDKIKPIS